MLWSDKDFVGIEGLNGEGATYEEGSVDFVSDSDEGRVSLRP